MSLVHSLACVAVPLFGPSAGRVVAVPRSVLLGILTVEEFRRFSGDDQQLVESTTDALLARYGEVSLLRERSRLRAELTFFTGAP